MTSCRTTSQVQAGRAARPAFPEDASAGQARARNQRRGVRCGCGSSPRQQHVRQVVRRDAERRKQTSVLRSGGFAHGFLVLSETAEFVYKCTRFYDPSDEGGLMWNDPEIGIDWPVPENAELLLSEKDQHHQPLKDFESPFTMEG